MTVCYRSKNPNGYVTGRTFSIDEPAATVMANGIASDKHSSVLLEDDGNEDHPPMADPAKPPYRVPLMTEVAAIPWNGLTVVSTFAGAGGSSTGYRMAGFRVLLASEFVPIAQDSYRANMGPHTVLDGRDVKLLTGADVRRATGLKAGDLDVLDGSPPCQAFSTAGRREKGWGTDKKYEHGAEQRNEDLFDEYVRLVRDLRPRVFVAENVSGLVKGVAKGYFLKILAALKGCGYRVEARLLDAQWLGVPQQRQRIIFVGVREDLGLAPAFPSPLPYRYSVRDALPWISGVRWNSGGQHGTREFDVGREPIQTIQATRGGSQQGYRVTHDTGGKFKSGGDVTDRPSPTITVGHANYGHFQVEPETDISRYAIGAEYDRLNPGQQSDKYFSLIRADADSPCPTIMSSSANYPSGASVVHPTEKRKFTIAEVRRLCGFPDDFVLKGTYGQQWERLGNSVPPVMMMHVASAIRDAVLLPGRPQTGLKRTQPGSPAKSKGDEPALARARTSGPGRRSAGRSTKSSSPKGAGKPRPNAAPSGTSGAARGPKPRTRSRPRSPKG